LTAARIAAFNRTAGRTAWVPVQSSDSRSTQKRKLAPLRSRKDGPAQILAETMHAHHRDEARGLAQQIMATEANLRPDPEAGTLTVEIDSLSTPPRQHRTGTPLRRTDRNPNNLPWHKTAPHLQEGIITTSVEVSCSEF